MFYIGLILLSVLGAVSLAGAAAAALEAVPSSMHRSESLVNQLGFHDFRAEPAAPKSNTSLGTGFCVE